MKNWEAYEDKIKELGGAICLTENNTLVWCNSTPCFKCKFNDVDNGCTKNMFNWLYEEYQKPKIKISKATKTILENLDDCWNWIAKDKNGTVFAYTEKPEKHNIGWGGNTIVNLNAFNSELFSFVSWNDEEPTNIKELLENAEVID